MKKVLLLALSILLLSCFTLYAEGQKEEGEEGWMMVGLVTDGGELYDKIFYQSVYDGMIRAAEDYELQVNYIETQQPTDYEKNIQTFAEEGYDIIITMDYMITDATLNMASQYTDTIFFGIDQSYAKPLPNTFGLIFAEDQAGFIAGALATMMSKTGIIGIVAGMEIPSIIKLRRGYENGAKHINPDIKVLGVYIDSFTAPDRGNAAAEAQIAEGADVIFGAGGSTGSGGIVAAMEKGVYGIGFNQDEYYTTMGGGPAPYLLSSVIKMADNAIYNIIKDYLEGTFEGVHYIGNVTNKSIGYAPFHDTDGKVPGWVKDKLDEIIEMLGDGSLETGVVL